jgi:hypothetical protein
MKVSDVSASNPALRASNPCNWEICLRRSGSGNFNPCQNASTLEMKFHPMHQFIIHIINNLTSSDGGLER